jgi:hypothetical protein
MKKIAKEKEYGKWMIGKSPSEETREKQRRIAKEKEFGKWMVGKINLQETRIKKSVSAKKKWENDFERKKRYSIRFSGENSPSWLGGKSFELYGKDYTKEVRKLIFDRDGGVCKLCGGNIKLVVHHIDYNKRNNNFDNLVTLCHVDNVKVNYNRRWWIDYFLEI